MLKKTKRKDWSYFYHQSNTGWVLCWWSTGFFFVFSELWPAWCFLLFFVKGGVLISSYVFFLQQYSALSTSVVPLLDSSFIAFASILWLWIWSFFFAPYVFNPIQITQLIVEIKYISSMVLSEKALSHKKLKSIKHWNLEFFTKNGQIQTLQLRTCMESSLKGISMLVLDDPHITLTTVPEIWVQIILTLHLLS